MHDKWFWVETHYYGPAETSGLEVSTLYISYLEEK